jgi:primosomal protein N'
MALRNTRQGDAATPPTARQLAEQHRRTAEVLLASGAKAGRLEAETRLAVLGTGHGVMALLPEQKVTNELLRRIVQALAPEPASNGTATESGELLDLPEISDETPTSYWRPS